MTRIASLALLALLAAGCRAPAVESDTAAPAQPAPAPSMPGSDVRIALDRASYRSGDDVKLTITNSSQRNLGYNACTRVVERESNGAWTAVPEPERVCTMELRLLNRGESVTEQTDLPAVSRGRYRIALQFHDESASGAPVRALSAPFAVE